MSENSIGLGNALLEVLQDEIKEKDAEIDRLRAAIRDAHALIDNDLVIPWIMAHKLDAILGVDVQVEDGNR